MRRISISLWLLVLFAFLIAPAVAQDVIWPTDGWQTSTPEAQGIDSAVLADLPERIAKEDLNIHSVLVIRNGYLVMEAYHYPYTSETLHHIFSSTKSVVSALVGIAIDQGYIEGVGQPMLDFFPDREVANLDAAKESITLENLLTMTSGLEWADELAADSILNRLLLSPDRVQFVLDRPMASEPGQQFFYNSGGSHLLASIVSETTGQNLADFAQTNLFDPIGIHSARWTFLDSQNQPFGGTGLMLTPRDMAKFGYLYLHNGEWNGQQIISSDWVAASSQKYIGVRPLTDGYGYQWWVDSRGFYMTAGYGGQHIIVHPGKNLIVVFTSGLNDLLLPQRLLQSIILPAIMSDEPLPENPEGQGELAAAVEALSQPVPVPVEPLPAIAAQISGHVYQLEANDLGWESLVFTFTDGSPIAQFKLNDEPTADVGLDDVFRVTPTSAESVLAKGEWATEDRFLMQYAFLGAANRFLLTATFEGETVKLLWRDIDNGAVIRLEGTSG